MRSFLKKKNLLVSYKLYITQAAIIISRIPKDYVLFVEQESLYRVYLGDHQRVQLLLRYM